MPSLSIITATFNAAKDLPNLVRSLENQTITDFEWIVVDGGSSDDTRAIVDGCNLREKLLICEPDRGIYDALNKGIKCSNADYYLVVGADDSLAPKAAQTFTNIIKAESADLITASVMIGGHISRPSPSTARFRSGPPKVSAHSVGTAIRKSLHEIHGYYSLDYPIAADTHFLRKVVRSSDTQIRYLSDIVGQFGSNGCSSRNPLRTICESLAANVSAGEPVSLQWLLFSLRLLKNLPRIKNERLGS